MDKLDLSKSMVHLSTQDLKEVREWSVGKKYTVKMVLKQISMHQDDMGYHAGFEILKVIPEKKENYTEEAVKHAMKGRV